VKSKLQDPPTLMGCVSRPWPSIAAVTNFIHLYMYNTLRSRPFFTSPFFYSFPSRTRCVFIPFCIYTFHSFFHTFKQQPHAGVFNSHQPTYLSSQRLVKRFSPPHSFFPLVCDDSRTPQRSPRPVNFIPHCPCAFLDR
jgi:hypothetical protein